MKQIFVGLLAFLMSQTVVAQEDFFAMGLLPDDGTYETLPRKTELLTRDYQTLPLQHSLMKYCPEVKSQSRYGTCASWAVAYAARTIAEAVKNGWTDKARITEEAFSPLFVYAQIKYADDRDCQKGSHIHEALKLMKTKGAVKYSLFDVLCASTVSSDLMSVAGKYRIRDFFTLFGTTFVDGNEKIRKVKKAISEDCPVMIAMHLPSSFHQAKDVWSGIDVDPSKHGYHAMCVIGYDDHVNGGSFHIMNSWGNTWGNNGFVWVRYRDFANYVDQAYELFLYKDDVYPRPAPKPSPVFRNKFSGDISLQLSTGEIMSPVLNTQQGIYQLLGNYISGTRYRVYVSNNEPAYVYIIGSDLQNNVSKVFPPADNISAALTYKSNHIAIPNEEWYVEMDDNPGTDYMCVLYSAQELDINRIVQSIKQGTGTFCEKMKKALGPQIVPANNIQFRPNSISFSAATNGTVVPIVVAINHK